MKLTIGTDAADQRYDRYLRKLFKKYREIWLGDIFSWIRTGVITVNGRKAKQDYRLKSGDVVEVSNIKEIESTTRQAFNTTLGRSTTKPQLRIADIKKLILYEDGNWIFWNKPAGVVIHPSTHHYKDVCMNDYLEQYLGFEDPKISKSQSWSTSNSWKTQWSRWSGGGWDILGGDYTTTNSTWWVNKDNKQTHHEFVWNLHGWDSDTFKPSYCYRLDKDTSGVLIAAKNYEALKHLNELIRTRDERIEKYYLAIVTGKPKNQTIDAPLFKWFSERMGKGQTFVNHEKWVKAVSVIETLQTIDHRDLGQISLIKVQILTGRMHQIRVHCAHIGYPVLWDIMYGSKTHNDILKKLSITRQLLHSYQYGFESVWGEYITRQCPPPQEFAFLGFTDYN